LSAARPASSAAPTIPAAPPTIATVPAPPLWKLRGRASSGAATRAPVTSWPSGGASEAASSPRSARCTTPQWSGPSSVYSPGLPAMNVIVWVARSATPITAPVSALIPLAMSSASLLPGSALAARRSSAASPASGRARPMPNRPSTRRS
jgi:hypothetical protein